MPSASLADSVTEQITTLVVQYYTAMTNADLSFIDDVTSTAPDAIAIGTDPTEVFVGHEAIVAWWQGIFEFLDMRGYPNGGLPTIHDNSLLQVNHKDGVAWATDTATWQFAGANASFPDGSVPFRLTLVFRKEQGQWRIVQQHFSIGVSNTELPI
jgi:ketosteroid isomerase-like protein